MGLETGTFLDDLVTANPVGATDDINKGDDHLRLIKSVLKATFPNATKAFRFESVLSKTSTYPVVVADARALILGDASGGAFSITLPLGSTVFAGYTILIMKSDSSGNAVTVDGNGAEKINGSLTRALTDRYQGEKYTWDGSEWKVIAVSGLVNDSVTFAKMQNITTARLLGRTTASSGDTEEIAVDGTMTLSSLTLGVKNAGIDTTQLASLAVETAKIQDLAVFTGKIANNAVTLDKLEHGTTGDVLYYGASGEPFRLAKGSDAEVLTLASGLPSWAAVSGITRETALTTTSGTTKTFTGIAAGANRITFILDKVSLTGSDELLIRIGDSGGIENSAYESKASRAEFDDSSTTGFLILNAGVAGTEYSGIITLARLDGDTWVSSGNIAGDASIALHVSAGTKTLSAELTQIQLLTTGSDTFDVGKVNILVE